MKYNLPFRKKGLHLFSFYLHFSYYSIKIRVSTTGYPVEFHPDPVGIKNLELELVQSGPKFLDQTRNRWVPGSELGIQL